jgi:hypothetical protein
MAKAVDLQAAKERKQKKIAAVGGVLLVIVLFVQVPRMLKMMDGGAEEPAVAAPSPAPATAPAPAPVGAGPTREAEGVVSASLISFSRFASKDPFVQQVKEAKAKASDGSTVADTAGGPDEPEGAIGGSEPDRGTSEPGPVARTTAEIEVNGLAETISVGTAFPAAAPMFLLGSVSAKSVVIKVADGGSFASGDPTLKLTLGKSVTLVNTADGTRFVLLLKDVA